MDVVEALRRFSRSHTRRIGLVDTSFPGSGRPVGAERLLLEIGLPGADVSEIRRRLDLDAGYTSRLLRRLESDGLIETVPDPGDGRRRRARLTDRGIAEWHDLDTRSAESAERLVASLTDVQRHELANALATAERLLRVASIRFEDAHPHGRAARTAMRQYFAELDRRFADGFDLADALGEDAAGMAPPSGGFVVAGSDGTPIACGGVQRGGATTGEIKRMWVHEEWRGLGLGRRMLEHLERLAASLGYERVILDTNDTLTEAIAMYERAGYAAIDRYNDNPYAHLWFAKSLSR